LTEQAVITSSVNTCPSLIVNEAIADETVLFVVVFDDLVGI
jgi:hypothetical protein